MQITIAVDRPVPHAQVEGVRAARGGRITGYGGVPGCGGHDPRNHTRPLPRRRDVAAVAVTGHAGRLVVAPHRRQTPAQQVPLRIGGGDLEGELVAASVDNVAHWHLHTIVENLLDVCHGPLVVNLHPAAVEAGHRNFHLGRVIQLDVNDTQPIGQHARNPARNPAAGYTRSEQAAAPGKSRPHPGWLWSGRRC